MRITVFVIGLISSIGSLFVGFVWLSILKSIQNQLADQSSLMGLLSMPFLMSPKIAAYTLIICAICGLLFSTMVLLAKGNKWFNAVMLVISGILPIFFAFNVLFGLPMILAGILAFAVKPKKPTLTGSDT